MGGICKLFSMLLFKIYAFPLLIMYQHNVSTHDFNNNDVGKLKTEYLLILL